MKTIIKILIFFILLTGVFSNKIESCQETVPSQESVLTISEVSSINRADATGGGNVASDGGMEITTRDGSWATSACPGNAGDKTTDRTGAGSIVTTFGTGQSNTTAIVTYKGDGSYAAQLCNDLVLNSYSDWYLPSKNELALINTNIIVNGTGLLTYKNYWSSSEVTNSLAWCFYNGTMDVLSKSSSFNVIAIRAF